MCRDTAIGSVETRETLRLCRVQGESSIILETKEVFFQLLSQLQVATATSGDLQLQSPCKNADLGESVPSRDQQQRASAS